MSKARSKEREQELKEFIKLTQGKSYTKRALMWFQQNIGQRVVSKELARLPGSDNEPIQHSLRRFFELRDEQGYEIINWKSENNLETTLK